MKLFGAIIVVSNEHINRCKLQLHLNKSKWRWASLSNSILMIFFDFTFLPVHRRSHICCTCDRIWQIWSEEVQSRFRYVNFPSSQIGFTYTIASLAFNFRHIFGHKLHDSLFNILILHLHSTPLISLLIYMRNRLISILIFILKK